MPSYITGIVSAFLSPILQGWANIFDSYFSNKIFTRLPTLIFFSQATNLIFLPIVFVLDPPKLLSVQLIPILLLIGLIEVLYQYPYYWSMRHADTSVVNALFSLGKIFVPLFAFLLVGERISNIQYLGFFTIILSSILLTLDFKKIKLNAAFFLMLIVSIILSLQSILFKYLYEQGTSWSTAIVWAAIVEFLFALIILLIPRNLKDFVESSKKIQSVGPLFLLAQFLSWSGEILSTYAIYVIPVSIVKGITSTQPIFVLIYALIFGKKKPELFKESLAHQDLIRKSIFIVLLIVGTILIVVG